MKSIFIPNESFNFKSEIKCVNKLLINNSEAFLRQIDDSVEMWIIGDKDKDFFDVLTKKPLEEKRVLDPGDGIPVAEYKKIQHIAVIYCNGDDIEPITREYIFGNTDYDVYDFVLIVLNLLKTKFPKKNPNELTDNIDKQYMFRNSNNNISSFKNKWDYNLN